MEVVLGLFLPKHCTIIPYSRARHIEFGGHLGGFGADMFEAEIDKGKEKIEHCAYLQEVLRLSTSLYKPQLMCRKVNLLI